MAKKNGKKALREKRSDELDRAELLRIHELMVEGRILEETLIAMYRRGDGYFWIGGPGEEAFNVPLGLLIKKGQGPEHDYLHFHYRNSATYLAMGGEAVDAMRQMRCVATDPFSGGRNFVNHYSRREWNIVPVQSTIETQYTQAPGTAWIQRRHGGDGISIVTGGDAGAAEGDFATCLVWSSRPEQEVPLLIVLVNNEYGISTPRDTQWPMRDIITRAEPFGIPTRSIDGNDVFTAWDALKEAMDYCRKERKPFALQANCSRLHGHSSASGAERVDEDDCLHKFEETLVERKIAKKDDLQKVWQKTRDRMKAEADQVRSEPFPEAHTIYDHIYAEG
jgi:2-oxoisovalerate dehydrogenase E1 component alpha subunit